MDLAPSLHVSPLRASVLRSDRTGVKVAADSGALAHSDWGKGGVQNAGQACGGRGQHDVATACGVPCVLPGKLPLDHRIPAVAGCTGSQDWRCTYPCFSENSLGLVFIYLFTQQVFIEYLLYASTTDIQ